MGGVTVLAIGDTLSAALAIVAIATLAGLGLLRGTVTNLREQLKDEREARTADRQQKADDDIENARYRADVEAKLASQDTEITALRRIVTGEIHWVAIEQRLEDAIAMLMSFGKRLEEALGVVRRSARARAESDDK